MTDFGNLIVLACLAACLVLGVAVMRRWRLGVYALFVWFPFEDLLRKFSDNNLAIYFIKDLILVLTYVSFVQAWAREKRDERFVNPVALPLMLWFIMAATEVMNPETPSLVIGLMGMRMHFVYVPLLYLGYRFVDSEERIAQMGRVFLTVGAVVGGAGLVQLVVGPEALNPPHIEGSTAVFTGRRGTEEYGEFFYLTSVFNNAARFGRFLLIDLAIALGIYVYAQERWRRLRAAAMAIAFLMFVNLVVTGSRTVLLVVITFLTVFAVVVFGAVPGGRWRSIAFGRALLLIAMISLTGASLVNWMNPDTTRAVFGFYLVTLSPGSREFELIGRLTEYSVTGSGGVWGSIETSGLFGHGTGTASQGLQYFPNVDAAVVEGGYASIAWEHGALGLVLVWWWAVRMLVAQFGALRRLFGAPLFGFAAALYLWSVTFLLPLTFMGIQSFQDFVPNAAFWFLSGVLLSLPNVSRRAGGTPPSAPDLRAERPSLRRAVRPR